MNTQKSVVFLYNDTSVKEIKKTLPSSAASTRRYLGMNLLKEVRHPNNESCKTGMKEMEKDTNGWEGTLCSWMARTDVV